MQVPTWCEGYSSNIKNLVSMKDLKLVGMKSHDCHVMMTQMLPIAIRRIKPDYVKLAVTLLCYFFNTIAHKVIDPAELSALNIEIAEMLCLLEMVFPLSLFDMMVHLLGHMVDEIKILDPVFLHKMYPFEQYMAVLKRYVRNRANPEGCMIQGYHTEEVIESCTDYIDGMEQLGVPAFVHEGWLCGRGRVGRKTWNDEGHNVLAEVHASILQQLQIIASYATT